MTLVARFRTVAAACVAAAALGGCGGSTGVDNPPSVANPVQVGGQTLSFIYFQKCIQPILVAPLPINQNGTMSINTCASVGCHDTVAGTGGAFRLVGSAAQVDLSNPANTPAAVRTTDMYRNFYSAKGSTVIGAPMQSRLLLKPLVLNVLHGGGIVFESLQNINAQRIQYWISRPVPLGQDEFSAAANSMFTPADPNVGTCNTQ